MNLAPSKHFDLRELEEFDPQSSTRSGASSGRERRFLCPLCGDGKPRDAAHRSVCVNLQNGAWNCKRCKATGKLTDFWQERPKSNPQQISREMSRRQVVRAFTLPESPRKEPALAIDDNAANWRDQLRDIRVLDCDGTGAAHALQAEAYLRGRGIDLETAIAAGVMFAPKFYGRGAVIFPICDRNGQQTGASGRYFHANASPKTRIAGTKRNGLFATSGAFASGALAADTIIVTEAPIDALSLASVGFAAVALCGTSAPAWMHLACGLKRVVLAFDADDAGDNAATALASFLSPYGARCERLRPKAGKDWNEALQRDSGALRAMLTDALADAFTSESSTRDERLCESPGECWPRELYNPQAARVFVERDQTLLPDQRATLLQYAARAVA